MSRPGRGVKQVRNFRRMNNGEPRRAVFENSSTLLDPRSHPVVGVRKARQHSLREAKEFLTSSSLVPKAMMRP